MQSEGPGHIYYSFINTLFIAVHYDAIHYSPLRRYSLQSNILEQRHPAQLFSTLPQSLMFASEAASMQQATDYWRLKYTIT